MKRKEKILSILLELFFGSIVIGIPIIFFLIWIKLIWWAIIVTFGCFIFLPAYVLYDQYSHLIDKIKEIVNKNQTLKVIVGIVLIILFILAIWASCELTYIIEKKYFPEQLEKNIQDHERRLENCNINSQSGRWICD